MVSFLNAAKFHIPQKQYKTLKLRRLEYFIHFTWPILVYNNLVNVNNIKVD